MINQMNSPWTDERITVLRADYAEGYSCAQIAARIGDGISRNAVIGKVHRLGLEKPLIVKKPARETRPRKQSSRQRHIPGTNRFYEAVSNPAEIKLRCVEITPRNVTLIDLEPGDCRYPYGGDIEGESITFCGHPKQDGSQYCTPHHHLCWVAPIVRVKAPTFRPYALGAA